MANDIAHTPGPWKIEAVYLAPHRTHFGEYRFPHQAVDGHSREYSHSEAEANAALIAAAPELLEALKVLRVPLQIQFDLHQRMCEAEGQDVTQSKAYLTAKARLDLADSAIAKAEGRQ
jgi:uncharacterized protein YbbK (DUF523 family)